MEHNISILFYRKMAKKTKGNLVPIYMRITVNGERIEQATGRSVHLFQELSAAGRMKGTHARAKVLNNFLDTLRNKVYVMEREMVQDGLEITFQSFKEKWSGADEKSYMLLEVFKQHNDEVAQ